MKQQCKAVGKNMERDTDVDYVSCLVCIIVVGIKVPSLPLYQKYIYFPLLPFLREITAWFELEGDFTSPTPTAMGGVLGEEGL